jgi:hypothetical protein
MRLRETIAHRIEAAKARPIDPVDLLAGGAITLTEAAQQFGRSAKTWKRLVNAGELPVVSGKPLLIPRRAIVLYLADRLQFRQNLVVLPEPVPSRRRRPREAGEN